MPHPDLYDELAQTLVAGFDAGRIYARIDEDRGLVWQHTDHGGIEDALPRHLLIIASTIQQYIEDGGSARWESRFLKDGVLWTEENEWMPLSDIGVNKQM